uniref:Uncharacterized protein n=1 Tax=Tanacetum cinerariifolium TaxID=118510 RepID=A0A6L2LGW1_TANCI|nr:hypothetical protein [Tanacetum cinerariifolium]
MKIYERVAVLDACLDKMAKEGVEEFSPMLRDVTKTKEFLIGKGFLYFLNKYKESDILRSNLGACIYATIFDGMRHGLEARYVHGKKGTDINYIPAYNPDVEACVEHPFSYLEALFVMGWTSLYKMRPGLSQILFSAKLISLVVVLNSSSLHRVSLMSGMLVQLPQNSPRWMECRLLSRI